MSILKLSNITDYFKVYGVILDYILSFTYDILPHAVHAIIA